MDNIVKNGLSSIISSLWFKILVANNFKSIVIYNL